MIGQRLCVAVVVGLAMACGFAAHADILVTSITRDISTDGTASYYPPTGAPSQVETFSESDAAPGPAGPWSSLRAGSAQVFNEQQVLWAWASGETSQNSNVGATSFSGSGTLDIVAGTAVGPLMGVSANAAGVSEFLLDFVLTAPTEMDLIAFHSNLESGAAFPGGIVRLQGPGVDFACYNNSLSWLDVVLAPGAYHFEARLSGTADDLPGEAGGTSSTHGSYNFSLNFANVPEPSTLILLGLGSLALAGYRKLKR